MKVVTKESIRELPLIHFAGKIHIVDTEEKCVAACEQLSKEKVIGFDTEKKPTFKKGEYNHPALVQLSTETDAYLFQLKKIGFGDELKGVLADASITKLGVAITDDLKDLKKLSPFRPDGFIELADMAKEKEIPYFGLRNLTAFLIDRRLSKGQQVSNWENTNLTKPQQLYASTDAWIALKIFEQMQANY